MPNSFRFTGSRGYVISFKNQPQKECLLITIEHFFSHALSVQKKLKEFYIPQITSIQHEGSFVEAPVPVPWYPDELAWSMTTPKNIVRRFAPFASFQKFLVSETEVGNISRQEVVSMIPPLFLDVKPGMTVLDMCAAPGSKSAQLMEMIHAGEEDDMKDVAEQIKSGSTEISGHINPDDGRSTGLLIANDSDYKRAHLLIHQMKRLNSPNLIVTNHDATMYPSIKLPSIGSPGKVAKYLKFDRILTDVPCSGDGTMRKNSNVWKDWAPTGALGLYATQMRILVRALQLLKVGGRVVYSTCSMNPIENEAVVASAIDRCGGSSRVKIIDCSSALPTLMRKPGLKSWKVMDRDGRLWDSWTDVDEYRLANGIHGLGRLAEGMFPPTGELSELPLDRCMRIYPHLQDTGGFFIAVLEKKSEIQAKPEDSSKVIPKASVAAVVEEIGQQKHSGNGEPLQEINSIDRVTPLNGGNLNGTNATAAESSRQPLCSTIDAPTSPTKRCAEHLEDQVPSKRTKLADDGTETMIEDQPVRIPQSFVETMRPTAVSETQPTDATQTDSRQPPAAASIPEGNKLPEKLPPPPQKRKNNQPMEEAFKFVDPQKEELKGIFHFYNVADRFPRDRFLVRNAQGMLAKSIYYTTELAREILIANEGRGIKFVHCGIKMFVKQDAQRADVCRWRIQNDGLQILEPWVGPERVVTLTRKDTLYKLLIEMFPKIDGDRWKHMGEIGQRTRDISMGCCVLRVEPSQDDLGLQ